MAVERIPYAHRQSRGHSYLQGRLGNKGEPCVQQKRKALWAWKPGSTHREEEVDWEIQIPELLGWELAGQSDWLGEEVERQEQY